MSVKQFLEDFKPGTDPDEDILSELSGISNEESARLAREWARWPGESVLQLQTKLVDLASVDTGLEFECVFKAGLNHADPRVRAASAHGLTETGDVSAVSRIVDLLRTDPDLQVRTAAATALSGFASLAIEGRLSERVRSSVHDALMEVLNSREAPPELWRRALEAAGAFGGKEINSYIQRAFTIEEPDFKRSVLLAVARTSDPRWLDAVVNELEHRDATVRFEAVNALGEIGEEEDAFYLEEPLDDQDLMVQLAAVAAAEKLGGNAAKRLLQIAGQSPEPAVASAAKDALKGISGDEALVHTVTPEMARQGLFGARPGSRSDDSVPYDAAEREGWGNILEDGSVFQAPDTVREDDDDPLNPLLDYERPPDQYEDDD